MRGYIALISILIISAIVILIAASANLISISESKMGLKESESWQAFYLTTACAEEALQQIKDSTPYEGSGNIPIGQGSCAYTVTKLIGENRIITATGTVRDINRRVKITIDKVNPTINIVSWQEVADF